MKSSGDTHLLKKSTDIVDLALLTSFNATIVSNDFGALHALINGGMATVFRPEPKSYDSIPLLLGERIPEWYSIL